MLKRFKANAQQKCVGWGRVRAVLFLSRLFCGDGREGADPDVSNTALGMFNNYQLQKRKLFAILPCVLYRLCSTGVTSCCVARCSGRQPAAFGAVTREVLGKGGKALLLPPPPTPTPSPSSSPAGLLCELWLPPVFVLCALLAVLGSWRATHAHASTLPERAAQCMHVYLHVRKRILTKQKKHVAKQ